MTSARHVMSDYSQFHIVFIVQRIEIISFKLIVVKIIHLFFQAEGLPEIGDSRERIKHFTFDYCYDSSMPQQSPAFASQQLVSFVEILTRIWKQHGEGEDSSLCQA